MISSSGITLYSSYKPIVFYITYNYKTKICKATQSADPFFPFEKEIDINCFYEILSIVSDKPFLFKKCLDTLIKSKLI